MMIRVHTLKPSDTAMNLVGILDRTLVPSHIVPIAWLRYLSMMVMRFLECYGGELNPKWTQRFTLETVLT